MSQSDKITQRFRAFISVFTVIQDASGHVLLQRRANTGYMDGYFDFPSGHLEAGETLAAGAARETKEEVGLEVATSDLVLYHINQNAAEAELPYINFIFKATKWQGIPKICKSEKCDKVAFYSLRKLPKITPQVERALKQLNDVSVSLSYFTKIDFE